jgi:hypothetical protein
MSRDQRRALARWLETAPTPWFVVYAMAAAFTTYFCMYAFRKPFAAAQFSGLKFLGTSVDLKTAFAISQIVGYALSKYLGVKVCSEATRAARPLLLVGLIGAAEGALLLFALLPNDWKIVALFLNGLPLGMVWGLVVAYLEGRQTSELLLAGLSCSFIVSSGAVKDVGRYLMTAHRVAEAWMPFATGLAFLPLFLGSVWLLDQLPRPTPADEAARVARPPLSAPERLAFVRRFFLGLVLLLVVYFFLTAFRDFRDNFAVEVLGDLGYGTSQTVLTRTELLVALGVMAAMALLNLIRDNRRGLAGAFALMVIGLLLMAGGTWLLDHNGIDGFWWMVLIGLGAYLAYVPYNSVLFDRLIASTRVTGTAVFAIYVADAAGYTGSVGVQLYKDLAAVQMSRLQFLRAFTYILSLGGALLLAASCLYFLAKSKRQAPMREELSLVT